VKLSRLKGPIAVKEQAGGVAAKLNEIRSSYLKQLPAQLAKIRASYAELVAGAGAGTSVADLHRLVHSMRGACASFRVSALASLATTAEQLVKEVMRGEKSPDRAWQERLLEQFARMEQELSVLNPAQGMESPIQGLAPPAEEAPERERKVVYLCDDDQFQRLSLTTQIGCFGFEVNSFGESGPMIEAVRSAAPDAIVMDMILEDGPLGGCEVVQTIQAMRENPIPTVFISSQDTLPNRLSAVRAGGSAYFVKPINAIELCSTLSLLTSAVKPEPYRILIVDDDEQLAEYHALLLQEAGMLTRIVNDPLQSIAPLNEFQPDLILMDMYMPGCDGMELAKAIRQIHAYISIPIVYLSSETDSNKQFAAMQIGGDAFLTKPISPGRLVSSVVVRAERMKVIRSFMVRDSMTGLLNHTSTKEQLDTAIGMAQRKREEVCFAMIDVDKFKMVNDSYGHPTGDLVLIALARLLGQRVRKTDTVGRFGGEEFAVILPGCGIDEAAALMDNVRESFAAVSFQAKDVTFSCSFSCGIAPLSRYGDAIALLAGADEALYAAKHGGRNRIVIARGGCGAE
jgi:diguanylate cyclase (GGDEF)-like protein